MAAKVAPGAPLPGGPLGKEPAGTIGFSISFILFGLWMVLKASGIEVTEDLSTGIEWFIYGLISIPAISGALTRFFVFSPAGAQKELNKAATAGVAPQVTTPPVDTDPRYNPNDPNEVPPSQWASNQPHS